MKQTVQASDLIECSSQQLANGQCSMDVSALIGKQKGESQTLTVIAQDLVLSATFMIGSVVTVWLMVSGLIYIFAKDSAAASKAKNGIKWSLVGLLLVMASYTIIRLVQYLMKG